MRKSHQLKKLQNSDSGASLAHFQAENLQNGEKLQESMG